MQLSEETLRIRREKIAKHVLIKPPPIVATYGMALSYEEGQAVWRLPYSPKFDHAAGGVHGSVLSLLLDNAGWFTIVPYYENWIATIEFQTRLLAPVKGDDLWSIGHIVSLGKRIATANMEVKSNAGKLVAVGSGTFTVTSVPLPFA